jgi:type I site-specific restriction endonuclease
VLHKFSPGFFDLIILDEAHRSIFKRFTEVIEYFDARMIGLTATPANFIDRDTFRVFGCDGSVPTFLYDYQQAINDKFLVDFTLYQAQTGFQRKGIKGVDLSEEDKNALGEQGIDPDTIDYSGTDIEKAVSNRDTLRRQLEASSAATPSSASSRRGKSENCWSWPKRWRLRPHACRRLATGGMLA